MFSRFRNKGNKTKDNEFFLKNGASVFESVIRTFNGDCNLIRSYSAQELVEATSDFKWPICDETNYVMYKGIHEGREISVKKFLKNFTERSIAQEVAIASRMSKHNNVLKLLGCCLETELPILVYEFPTNGNLGSYIYDYVQQHLPWESKLRIAIGIANAVAYLHHGLPKTIIHRDIKPSNIFLDQNGAAKLFDFQLAIPIPEGKFHVNAEAAGTIGFIPADIFHENDEGVFRYTEKTDVYGFGILLCELLTQKRIYQLRNESHNQLTDPHDLICFLFEEESAYWDIYRQENRTQVMELVKLAARCVKKNPDDRPDMIKVGKVLGLIKKKGDNNFWKTVLEGVINSANEDCNLIRSYCAKELSKATSNLERKIHEDSTYIMYKGIHEGREILVKKFITRDCLEDDVKRIENEVAIGSRMSKHNNALKLFGCCFETESPILVYEFPTNGNLGSYIYDDIQQHLPWESKVRIAAGIADAVAYLHHRLPKKIIHRDIKPSNIFLDQNGAAKLFDFQLAISIPEGEFHVDAELVGTLEFLPPEIQNDFPENREAHVCYTEKTDVYSFGMLLCEVLTRTRFHKLLTQYLELNDESHNQLTKPDDLLCFLFEEGSAYWEINPQENRAQVMELVKLAAMCVKENPDDRPNMIEVGKALGFIKTI